MSERGPNVRRLIIHKMSILTIPFDTTQGQGLATGVEALSSPGNIGRMAREATDWVEAALAAVKAAPGNLYGDNDEAIARAILDEIEARKASR